MGLDNGLIMRGKLPSKEDLPRWFLEENSFEAEHIGSEFGFCYWRKRWDIRDLLYKTLTDGEDGYGYCKITEEGLADLRLELAHLLTDKNYYARKMSREGEITWAEDLYTLSYNIACITWALEWARTHAVEFYFYDSY